MRSGWAFTSSNTFGVTSAGELFATSGKISNFYINESSIYNGEFGTAGSVLLSTGYISSAEIGTITGEHEYAFGAGASFGVTTAGYLTSSAGNIAGWEISPTSLSHGTLGSPFGYILDSYGQTSATINGETLTGLMMVVGTNFGLDKDGIIYTNGGVFSGDIIGGTITSRNYSSDSYIKTASGTYVLLNDGTSKLKKTREDNYSNQGMMIDLNRGIISTSNFFIAQDGSVNIRNVSMGGSHTAGLVRTEQYVQPSVGNENNLINANGTDSPATKYYSQQGIKLNLNNSGFFTSKNFAIDGNGSVFIRGVINGHLGSSSTGFTISNSAIYNGTNSISSIAAGTYYGTDGLRNYTSGGNFVTITSGNISTNGTTQIGATNGNHLNIQNNGSILSLAFLNSSNSERTRLDFAAGGYGRTWIKIVPKKRREEYSSSSQNLSQFMQSHVRWLCTEYPSHSETIFTGLAQNGSLLFYAICIYNTSKLSNGSPEYAYGFVTQYGGVFATCGFNSYNWYYSEK